MTHNQWFQKFIPGTDDNVPPWRYDSGLVSYGQLTISHNTTAIAVTAAVDPTLYTNSDYIQITGIWDAIPVGVNQNLIQETNDLKVITPGNYEIGLWINVTTSVANANVALRYTVNGTISLGRRPRGKIGNANDVLDISAYGFLHLNAGDTVGVCIACDKTCDVTIQDCVHSLKSLTGLL